jgi:hypothetical protein
MVHLAPAMEGAPNLSDDLRAAGFGMVFCHEGMGREKNPSGSSPAEDLVGIAAYVGRWQ